MAAQTNENRIQAPNLARSAIAPLIRATVMMANVSWKAEKTRLGMPEPSSAVAVSTRLCRPSASNPPTKASIAPLGLGVKARECPKSTQATVTTIMAPNDIIIMFRTLLALVIPP